MIQCLWGINNFKGYHPELQVSCKGVSKTISHMQQHFRDGNCLLIPLFVIPCLPSPAHQQQHSPHRCKIAFLSSWFSPPSCHRVENYSPGLIQWLSLSRSVQSYLWIPQPWWCSRAGRVSPAQGCVLQAHKGSRKDTGHWEAHGQAACSGWALPHGAGGTTDLEMFLCLSQGFQQSNFSAVD